MNKKNFVAILIMFVFFASGYFFGRIKLSALNDDIIGLYDESVCFKLNKQIDILTNLKNNEISLAVDKLELLVDSDVSYLGVKLNNEKECKNIIGVLKAARDYRRKYQDHKPDKVILPSLERAFLAAENKDCSVD